MIGGILCGQFHRRGSNKSDVLKSWFPNYRSMRRPGFVAQGRVMTFWVGWRGDWGWGMAVGMISCTPVLMSIRGYKRFHSFAKLFSMVEGAKNVF